MWEALQHLKDSPDYERSFEKYAQMFSAEDYLDSFFDESPFSVFGPDFLFQAALYNACATRDFSLAERLLLLYGRHPQATQQMKLKFERDVTLAKKEFPELIFSWCFPIMENRKRDAF